MDNKQLKNQFSLMKITWIVLVILFALSFFLTNFDVTGVRFLWLTDFVAKGGLQEILLTGANFCVVVLFCLLLTCLQPVFDLESFLVVITGIVSFLAVDVCVFQLQSFVLSAYYCNFFLILMLICKLKIFDTKKFGNTWWGLLLLTIGFLITGILSLQMSVALYFVGVYLGCRGEHGTRKSSFAMAIGAAGAACVNLVALGGGVNIISRLREIGELNYRTLIKAIYNSVKCLFGYELIPLIGVTVLLVVFLGILKEQLDTYDRVLLCLGICVWVSGGLVCMTQVTDTFLLTVIMTCLIARLLRKVKLSHPTLGTWISIMEVLIVAKAVYYFAETPFIHHVLY